jgi:DNA polymerase III subunit delta'
VPAVRLADLLGQPEASTFLRGVVKAGRYSNAYLFHGLAGVGKGTAAIAFARAILCERNGGAREGPQAPAEPGLFDVAPATTAEPAERLGDACGVCRACIKSAELQHPDLKFLFPVSGEEGRLDETIQETVAAWREDPFFVFGYEKAASIRLSMTRELLRELAFKPFEAERRVVVVRDADRMREDQCSALLKSIEEPGLSTVWVLTTSRPTRLPATIRSRCQRVRFLPLGEAAVTAFLEERGAARGPEARMLAALACGSLARALVLREIHPKEARDRALSLIEPALRGDMGGLWRNVTGFNRGAGRETMRRTIEFQELWLRDLLRARYGAPREALVNRDREAEVRRQAEALDAREIRRRLMVLEEALRSIEGNVTPDLAMFSALARVADPEFDEGTWPGHSTARWDY